MSATADPLTDPELLATAWDLDPLVEGEGRRFRGRPDARRGGRRRVELRRPVRRQGRELDATGLERAMHELERIHDLDRTRRLLRRRCGSRPTPPTRRAARCCSACRSAPPRSRPSCCSSSSSGRRSTTRAPTSCSPSRDADAPTAWRSAVTTCAASGATGPTCCPSPRRRSWPRSRSRPTAPGTGCSASSCAALRVDLDDDEVTLDVALSRLQFADRSTRQAAAEAVTGALEPGLRTRGVHLQHARLRQVRRRPAALATRTGWPAATSPTRPPTSP